MTSGRGLILADSSALLRGYEEVPEKLEEDVRAELRRASAAAEAASPVVADRPPP